MILVATDTTPLRHLAEIGYESLLPRLFTRVWIPGAVSGELRQERYPSFDIGPAPCNNQNRALSYLRPRVFLAVSDATS